MTMKEGRKEGRKGGGEEGRREGRRHKKLRGNKFIQPFFPPRLSFGAKFHLRVGEQGNERCPEICRKTPNCSFSFLPLQRSKLREALEATHHKSSSSSATAAAKSCLNLCEKLEPLGKLFVFFFLRQKSRL